MEIVGLTEAISAKMKVSGQVDTIAEDSPQPSTDTVATNGSDNNEDCGAPNGEGNSTDRTPRSSNKRPTHVSYDDDSDPQLVVNGVS